MGEPRTIWRELDAAAALVEVCRQVEREAESPQGMLLAIASRETGCLDVDTASGHGPFQLDGPLPLLEAARHAHELLTSYWYRGLREGVRGEDLPTFAFSAWQLGVEPALEAYRAGGPSEYANDVLARVATVQEWLTKRFGAEDPPTLVPGVSGDAVVELKRLLRGWYEETGRQLPRRMRGPVYGAQAMEAVIELQRAHDLIGDGIVGPKTWRALRRTAERGTSAA